MPQILCDVHSERSLLKGHVVDCAHRPQRGAAPTPSPRTKTCVPETTAVGFGSRPDGPRGFCDPDAVPRAWAGRAHGAARVAGEGPPQPGERAPTRPASRAPRAPRPLPGLTLRERARTRRVAAPPQRDLLSMKRQRAVGGLLRRGTGGPCGHSGTSLQRGRGTRRWAQPWD